MLALSNINVLAITKKARSGKRWEMEEEEKTNLGPQGWHWHKQLVAKKKFRNMPLQIVFKHLQSIYEYFIFCGWWRLFGVVSETNLKLIVHAKQ